jgi:hypothetical protein
MYQSDGSMDDFDKILASLNDTGDSTVKDTDKYTYDLFGEYHSLYDPSVPLNSLNTSLSISPLTTTSIPTLTTSQITSLTSSSLHTWTLPQNNTGVYTVTVGGSGSGGSGVISNGTIGSTNATWSTPYSGVKIKGDADVDGDIIVKGESISDLLKNIQDKLAIFKPNPELEEKWENLRDLARQYRELERDIKEKELIWQTLKK